MNNCSDNFTNLDMTDAIEGHDESSKLFIWATFIMVAMLIFLSCEFIIVLTAVLSIALNCAPCFQINME